MELSFSYSSSIMYNESEVPKIIYIATLTKWYAITGCNYHHAINKNSTIDHLEYPPIVSPYS
jgi:hypothetical protein